MGPVAIIAGIGLAISAGSAVMSYSAQKKQVKMQKRAASAQRAQDNMKAARERREAIRSARIAAGTSAQNAANQGVSNSSAALGAQGSIQSQLNQGLSFLDGMNTLADQAGRALTKANEYGVQAQTWNTIGKFGQQLFASAGKMGGGG